MSNHLEDKILDYLEKKLTEVERAEFERVLTEDPQLRSLLKDYQDLVKMERLVSAEPSKGLPRSIAAEVAAVLPARYWYQRPAFQPARIYGFGAMVASLMIMLSFVFDRGQSRGFSQRVALTQAIHEVPGVDSSTVVEAGAVKRSSRVLSQGEIIQMVRSERAPRSAEVTSADPGARLVSGVWEREVGGGVPALRLLQARSSGFQQAQLESAPERLIYELGQLSSGPTDADLEIGSQSSVSPAQSRNHILTLRISPRVPRREQRVIVAPLLSQIKNYEILRAAFSGVPATELSLAWAQAAEGPLVWSTPAQFVAQYHEQIGLEQGGVLLGSLRQSAEDFWAAGTTTRILIISDAEAELTEDLQAALLGLSSECAARGIPLSVISLASSAQNDSRWAAAAQRAYGAFMPADSAESLSFVLGREFSRGEILATSVELYAEFNQKELLGYRKLGESQWQFSSTPLRLLIPSLRAGEEMAFVFEVREHDAVEGEIPNPERWVNVRFGSAESGLRARWGTDDYQYEFKRADPNYRFNVLLALGAEQLGSGEPTAEVASGLQRELSQRGDTAPESFLNKTVRGLFS